MRVCLSGRWSAFFFFKQKTAYEIVPCDWSSDVCSSDLGGRRVGIDMRTADAANGVCRAVLLMVRMQNEQNVESAFQRGIGPVLRFRSPEKHVQKISRIAEIVVGIHVRHAQRVPVSKSRDRWHLANQAVSLLLA